MSSSSEDVSPSQSAFAEESVSQAPANRRIASGPAKSSRETTAAALTATKPWVDYVSTLTRAEAPALVPLIDIPQGALVLEPGGNSGAFARALIPVLHPTRHVVFDLPAVCALGQQRGTMPALSFAPGDMRHDDGDTIRDSQLCFLHCDEISNEDSTMCLLDGGNR